VLKHAEFAHLREVVHFPNTLNPHEAESLALVGAMTDQILELHKGARWLHIGCDEVSASPTPTAPSPHMPGLWQPLLFNIILSFVSFFFSFVFGFRVFCLFVLVFCNLGFELRALCSYFLSS
jgi:hypothetical protein